MEIKRVKRPLDIGTGHKDFDYVFIAESEAGQDIEALVEELLS